MDRQEQSDLLSAQFAVAGAGLAFLLAAVGLAFLNCGVAIAFLIAAIITFIASEKFETIQRIKLEWPLSISDRPIHHPWVVFRGILCFGIGIALALSIPLGEASYIIQLRRQIQTVAAASTERHLTDDQKARLRELLRLSPDQNYYVDFNSLPNCDECEDFAEELREFVATIPGWKTGGGPIMFWDNGPRLVGLELAMRKDEKDFPEPTKLRKAFDSASLPLAPFYLDNYAKGQAIIVVGKQPKQ